MTNEMKLELLPFMMLDSKDGKWYLHHYEQVLVPDVSNYTDEEIEALEEWKYIMD